MAEHETTPRNRTAALPAQPGPLVGRATELALISSRLARGDARLVTLAGAAGTGKTRLAVEVAGLAAAKFRDGTYFIDLAPISDPALLAAAIARATQIREERDRPLLDILEDQLADREMLLLLDNFEQILAAAPQLSRLLAACPGLTFLVTSRSALRLRWEHVIPVSPLALPDLKAPQHLHTLAEVAAVDLFAQRAQLVDPGFSLTQTNVAAVAEICVRLDGLPLAIELAAARTRVLPPHALLNRLSHRLDVLSAPGADQPARQRTLRAALNWSYELLSPAEQAFFRRLGVFVGGFGLGAVAEVCDPDPEFRVDSLAAIESLVGKSLIRQEPRDDVDSDPRFGMLETIREYALERLAASAERELTLERHARYYLSGADVPVAEMKVGHQALWLQSLEADHDNLRAALAWCEDSRAPELGLSAASLLAWFWIVRGHVGEGRRRLTSLLNLASDAPLTLRSDALRVIGSLALHQADYAAARAQFEASLEIRRHLGDPPGLLSALSSLGAVVMQQGELERAEAYFNEALAIQQAIDDRVGMAESFNNLANIAHERGDLLRARELYETSLSVQQTGVRYRPDVVLHNLGVVAAEQGDITAARRYVEDSVAMRRALGDTPGLALSLAKLGEIRAQMGDQRAAHYLLCESLTLQRDLGDRLGMAFVLERFSLAAIARHRPREALRLAAAADALRDAIGVPLSPAARADQERWLAPVRGDLHPDIATAEWVAGRALSLDQVFAEALQFSKPSHGTGPQSGDGEFQLSAREREVAMLVAQGLSNREIAERLVVSERTAENHVQHVLNRLGLRSRAHVAAWAVRHGLV